MTKRDGDVHHDFIPGIAEGTRYGFRVEGPWAPELGLRFDPSKLLVDPYAWSLDRAFAYHDELSERGHDTAHLIPKCVAQHPLPDVERPPYWKPAFIYELPVRAFTKLHPYVPKEKRGTVAALAEPAVIAHLKDISVDTIELMPITAWIDERHLKPLGLRNAWGYNPVQFFAPEPKLAPGGLVEIRDTISELHKHGFRVILDIVLNHTGESDQFGPTLCFRGLDSPLYYAHSRGELINDTGCGNTVSLNEPHVVDMVISALRHWVLKAGVDGFRFDLATVMGRMADGFHHDAPLLKAIENDPVLSTCIMIAEPWDIGPGGYQLGKFPERWLEWNDKFRDDVRQFWRGDDFSANHLATRLAGSSGIFQNHRRSVNFLAAHDGFTLLDLTIYSEKANLANGENNRDGKSDEVTCNGAGVAALMSTLLLSRGAFMITAGDELGRTQEGNNNAYAQDNPLTWIDWGKGDNRLSIIIRHLCELRERFSPFFELPLNPKSDEPIPNTCQPFWFDVAGEQIDWSRSDVRFLGLALAIGSDRMAIVVNGSQHDVKLELINKKHYFWKLVYQSAHKDNCAALSVSVFHEVIGG